MRLAASFAGVARSEALDSGSRLLNSKRFGWDNKGKRNIRLNEKLGYQVFKHQRINDNLKPDLYGETEIGDLANCVVSANELYNSSSVKCLTSTFSCFRPMLKRYVLLV
jgi:hypothetical protein